MPDEIHICSAGLSDTGLRRSLNEDAYLIDEKRRCFVVSDGVGGAAAGEVASGIFINSVRQALGGGAISSVEDAKAVIKQSFLQANTEINEYKRGRSGHEGMACTAVMLLLNGEEFVLGHVGDSRVYRFRNGQLVQLTRDHSFVQQQLDLGTISEAEASRHRYRNVILRAVGTDEELDVDIIRGTTRPGDQYLQCSDGLTDMVPDSGISACLAGSMALDEKAATLVAEANRAGGKDNITTVLVERIR